jgi:2-amino-4-hydroxy-6-hydroxymethyldihydropteridine diphosphokinase
MNRSSAYLGLGSNIGDRMGYLKEALAKLAGTEGVVLIKLSPVYQTEPVGYEAQEDFYNMVVRIETTLSPTELLSAAKAIERDLGRVEAAHKGPRTIDIDILLLGDKLVNEYRLSVPHPRLLDREFVLRPLFDLDPNLDIVPFHTSVRDALSKIAGVKRVVRIEDSIDLSEVTDG